MLIDFRPHSKALCLILCIVVFLITGCQPKNVIGSEDGQEVGEEIFSFTFTDSTGSTVVLNSRPMKVAVLFSSYADIWVTAGGMVDITVGESVERGFADDKALLVDSGSGHTSIDMETLMAGEPDFVIGTADYASQTEAVEFCRSAGIPGALFKVESFLDYLTVLEIFCRITGHEENYQTYGISVRDRIKSLMNSLPDSAESDAPRILFVRAGSSARSTKARSTEDHFACRMLSELGAVNIADSDNQLTGTLSTEVILEEDPDLLFITTMGDEDAAKSYMNSLLESDVWQELTCVKEGNYYYLPKDLFHFKPNARWAEAYECLAKMLYPDLIP